MMNARRWIATLMLAAMMMPLAVSAQDDTTVQGPPLAPDTTYYAVLNTTAGDIVVEFYEQVAPKTVRNFVNLAEGRKPFRDPRTGTTSRGLYYDGVIFHRVIPGFMIQGGDPTGSGSGGPGFTIGEEFDPEVNFDTDNLIAMAHAGPGTSAAQFFITDKNSANTPSMRGLNQKYTIFGKVVAGQDVVSEIANGPTTMQPGGREKSRPVEPVTIEKVRILRVKKDSDETWEDKLKAVATPATLPAPAPEEAPATQPTTQPATQPAPETQPAVD